MGKKKGGGGGGGGGGGQDQGGRGGGRGRGQDQGGRGGGRGQQDQRGRGRERGDQEGRGRGGGREVGRPQHFIDPQQHQQYVEFPQLQMPQPQQPQMQQQSRTQQQPQMQQQSQTQQQPQMQQQSRTQQQPQMQQQSRTQQQPQMQQQQPRLQQQQPRPQQQQPRPQQQQPRPQQQQPRPQQQQPKPQPQVQQPQTQQKTAQSGKASSPGGNGYSIPLRKKKGPQVGTLGRQIVVETNYLALKFNNMSKSVYHYDVIIKPDKPFRIYRKVMEQYRRIECPTYFPAFDGKKNIYSVNRLKDNEICFNVFDEERNKEIEYTVEVKYASTVDMSSLSRYMRDGTSLSTPMEALQAIDIALRNPSALRLVQVGRSFFTPPEGRVISLGSGVDLWYGVFQSTVLGWKPYLNIDIAHKGFPEPVNCIKSLCNILQLDERNLGQQLQRYQLENYKLYVKGLKVDYEIPNLPHSKRTFKVADLSTMSAINYRFTHNKKEISVAEYFEREKGYRLRFPHLPCLVTGQSRNALPMELCFIKKGQVTQKKLDENQTREMVAAAARPAYERKSKILAAMRQVGFKGDSCIKEFGVEVSETFEKVGARILEPPRLMYQSEVVPSQGVWRASRFVTPVTLEHWGVVNTNNRVFPNEVSKLADEFSSKCSGLGMSIMKPMFVENIVPTNRGDNISNKLRDFFMKCKDKVQLVVVIIPDSGPTYAMVKKIAEIDVGILTQCLRGRTVKKINMSTVCNIFLKLNAKLNGVNHWISQKARPNYMNKPVMIVGADVTHPSPDQALTFPSIAAVAASHDPNAFKYNMLWRLQDARVEIIQDMEAIIKEHLMYFYKSTRFKPQAILFYRDGVSEGQFKTVLNTELTAIRRACSSLSVDYKPTITFLVVQKRHHTRFFPTRPQDEDGRNKNVPAGTIVDTDITHPQEFDFYLASHASIQGTSRPTKYHLLWDDASLSEDELEQITYYLCHMFTRCTRSVSYPAPTYYAHLAAFRVRSSYIEGRTINMTNLEHEASLRRIQDNIVKSNPMFFV